MSEWIQLKSTVVEGLKKEASFYLEYPGGSGRARASSEASGERINFLGEVKLKILGGFKTVVDLEVESEWRLVDGFYILEKFVEKNKKKNKTRQMLFYPEEKLLELIRVEDGESEKEVLSVEESIPNQSLIDPIVLLICDQIFDPTISQSFGLLVGKSIYGFSSKIEPTENEFHKICLSQTSGKSIPSQLIPDIRFLNGNFYSAEVKLPVGKFLIHRED